MLALLVISVFLACGVRGQTSLVDQATLDRMAQTLGVQWTVVTNTREEHRFDATLTLTNQDSQPITYGNWTLFFQSYRAIEPDSLFRGKSVEVEGQGLEIMQVNGRLYHLKPNQNFTNIPPGEARVLRLHMTSSHVARSEVFPNWYLTGPEGTQPRIIASTEGSDVTFFTPPYRPQQQKRYDHDLFAARTVQERYQRNYVPFAPPEAELRIIPKPWRLTRLKGSDVHLSAAWTVFDASPGKILSNEAEFIASKLSVYSVQQTTSPSAPTSQVIILNIGNIIIADDDVIDTNNDAHTLQVDDLNNIINITGRGPSGVFLGFQTLLSLLRHNGSIPKVHVYDAPRFSFRGVFLDIARNFHTREDIERLLGMMSLYKLNKLHLHLSDDEGWRIEIQGLPELTQLGAKRCHDRHENECLLSELGSGPFSNNSGSGFLSASDYQSILRMAARHHIEIIPEVDMPGHARAAIKAMEKRYRDLMAQNKPVEAEKYRLIDDADLSVYTTRFSDNIINVCMNSSYAFIHKVVEEIQRLHSTIQPLHEFHCGLDEVDKGAWLNSSLCQKLIQDQGLSNTSLQQYFFQRVAEITHSLGLSLGGWADGLILPGNQPFNRSLVPNEMVFANVWNNVWELGTSSHAYTMANMGYKVVMSHSTSLYFDHAQEPDWEERGFYWASRFIDSQKTFSFMPMNFYANIDTRRSGQPISREEVCGKDDINCPSLTKPQNIVGMQGHLWGDLIRTRDHMDSQLFPRMLALAERAWHHANWEKEQSTTVQHSLRMKDWYSYARAVGYQELPRLNGIGIKYRIPPPGAMVERKRLLVAPGYPLLTVEWSRDFGQTWHPVDGTERVENSERLWLRTRSANKQRCSRTVQLIPVGELQATAQQTLDYMGQHLHVTYEVADNYEQYGLSYYVVKLTLNNTGTQPIPGGNWQLHFPSVQWLEEGQLKEEKQFIIGEQGVALSHVQGYQFRLSPLPEFSPLENGMARVITFRGSYWSVSRYEQFPNYYVVAEGANARIIKNTKGESLSFVKDFAKVNQWKRDSTDKFDPLTPSARFSKQADVQDLGLAPHPYLPTPLHFEMDRSKTVSFAQGWVIVAPQEWKELADFLKDELKEKADLSVQQMAPASRYIELRQSSQDMPLSSWPGAYKLAVSPDRHTVLITATNITGALYGVQSLINMALQSVDGTTLFYVMATDSPRFPFRSMYLDVSRNFHTKHSVLAMLRAMGLYKLNKLHLHLADDEGWRLEIPGLPELTMIGSSRCHDPTEEQCLVPVMGSGPDPDNPGSGFYTIQDYQEILQAAAERHIEVIPEFDMPGHSRAAIKAMALRRQLKLEAGDFQGAHEYELDELGDHSKYSSVQLYNDNAVNPCLESSYRFIHHVIRQVKAIHANINPLRTYHFGGDEVASGAWVQSKACSEHVKQGVDLKLMFSVRVAALVATEGLNLAAWEDGIMDKGEPIPRLKMAPDQVFSNAWQNVWEWGNAARAYTLANHGYKVVMSQATHLYFDHPYEPSPEERGFYWATRYTDSRKTFLFQPEHLWLNVDMTRFGDPITLSQVCGKDNIGCPHLNLTNNVVGMQGHLWSETIRTARQLDYMIFPRFLAMAERAWHAAPWEGLESGADAEKLKDWTKFANTLGYNQLLVLDKLSIFYRVCPPGARREGLQVKVNTEFPGLKVQYLTSGFDQWQDVKAKQVDVKHGQTIQLRTLSADSKRASQPVMLEVPDINLDHASSGLSPPTLPCMSALIICLLVAWLHMLF